MEVYKNNEGVIDIVQHCFFKKGIRLPKRHEGDPKKYFLFGLHLVNSNLVPSLIQFRKSSVT